MADFKLYPCIYKTTNGHVCGHVGYVFDQCSNVGRWDVFRRVTLSCMYRWSAPCGLRFPTLKPEITLCFSGSLAQYYREPQTHRATECKRSGPVKFLGVSSGLYPLSWLWSVTTPLMSSTNVVPVETGCPPLYDFMLSLVSFMKNLSERFDDVVT